MRRLRRPPEANRAAGQRGFSLLELLVTLVLMTVAVLLAAQLVAAASRAGRTASNILRDPALGRFGVWVRRDMDAVVTLPPAGGWSVLALDLGLADGTTVRYDLVDGSLVRTVIGARLPAETGDRLLADVSSWRWRVDAGRLLVLEVKVPRHMEEAGTIGGSAAGAAPGARTERLTIGRRGLDGGRSW